MTQNKQRSLAQRNSLDALQGNFVKYQCLQISNNLFVEMHGFGCLDLTKLQWWMENYIHVVFYKFFLQLYDFFFLYSFICN